MVRFEFPFLPVLAERHSCAGCAHFDASNWTAEVNTVAESRRKCICDQLVPAFDAKQFLRLEIRAPQLLNRGSPDGLKGGARAAKKLQRGRRCSFAFQQVRNT